MTDRQVAAERARIWREVQYYVQQGLASVDVQQKQHFLAQIAYVIGLPAEAVTALAAATDEQEG